MPSERVRPNGQEIEQINPSTNKVVFRFSSVAKVQQSMQVARASLNSAIESGAVLKEYKWRRVNKTVETLPG